MSRDFRRTDRETPWLLPPSLQDWLPEGHLARFVVDIVEQLDLSELTSDYSRGGKRAYHPAMLLSLLFYGYATGIFSSRKLERATYESVAFRFVAANLHPDHDTIAAFRKRFIGHLGGLFIQILMMARTLGVLQLGNVSLDGTKIKANASKHKAMSWDYANKLEQQLQEEVAALLARAEQADEAEPDIGLDIPEELKRRRDRLEAIAAAKEEIAQRAAERHRAEMAAYEEKMAARAAKEAASGRKPGGRPPQEPQPGPHPKDQVNFTDPESRIMPSSEGFVQGFNAQATVDNGSHLIVAGHVTDACNDKQQIAPALEQLAAVEAVIGKPEGILADTGYFSADNVAQCEMAEVTPYIASGRDAHNQPLANRRAPVPELPVDADPTARAKHRLKTPEGKAIYSRRKVTVETVFGIIKEVMGFRRFHLRGLSPVSGEWTLISLAWNLKRMHALAS